MFYYYFYLFNYATIFVYFLLTICDQHHNYSLLRIYISLKSIYNFFFTKDFLLWLCGSLSYFVNKEEAYKSTSFTLPYFVGKINHDALHKKVLIKHQNS